MLAPTRSPSFPASARHIVVVGGGITGVTSAYALAQQGFEVTLIEKNRYPGMETSYANGGQLSASNAEVWTHPSTLVKGLKWMFKKDAPLLMGRRNRVFVGAVGVNKAR